MTVYRVRVLSEDGIAHIRDVAHSQLCEMLHKPDASRLERKLQAYAFAEGKAVPIEGGSVKLISYP
jgi:hypothetical protein